MISPNLKPWTILAFVAALSACGTHEAQIDKSGRDLAINGENRPLTPRSRPARTGDDSGVFFSNPQTGKFDDVPSRTENLFDEYGFATNPWLIENCALSFTSEKGWIWQVLHRQTYAWNKGDIEGFMEGYWQSDELVFTSGGRIRRGWQATLDSYKANYRKETMGQLTFDDLEIVLTADNEAVVVGRWRLDGLKTKPQGGFTLVFRKFLEGWRIIRDHTTSDG